MSRKGTAGIRGVAADSRELAARSGGTIDFCINNGIIGVQEEDAYAETEGKR